MNVFLWVLAGGIAGWIGLKLMHANEARGIVLTVIIGMAGGYFGGNVVAPMLSDIVTAPGAFSPFSLFVALASATAFLTISDMLAQRYDI